MCRPRPRVTRTSPASCLKSISRGRRHFCSHSTHAGAHRKLKPTNQHNHDDEHDNHQVRLDNLLPRYHRHFKQTTTTIQDDQQLRPTRTTHLKEAFFLDRYHIHRREKEEESTEHYMEMYRPVPQHNHNTQKLGNKKTRRGHNQDDPEKQALADKRRHPRAHPRAVQAQRPTLGLCHDHRDLWRTKEGHILGIDREQQSILRNSSPHPSEMEYRHQRSATLRTTNHGSELRENS